MRQQPRESVVVLMCDLCGNSGYIMQDIGTATMPDYIEIACRCNPEPADFDAAWYDHAGWFPDADYPADFDVVEVDYDRPIRDRDFTLPASLLA